jgi:hypothetical protein
MRRDRSSSRGRKGDRATEVMLELPELCFDRLSITPWRRVRSEEMERRVDDEKTRERKDRKQKVGDPSSI